MGAHATVVRSSAPPSLAAQTTALLVCGAGVYVSYLTQGVVQEALATKRFGANATRFNGLDALHGLQAMACALWALVLIAAGAAGGQDARRSWPPLRAYWRAGLSNAAGPTLGYLALKNISYAAQVLAKSCKMIPVMLVGTLVAGKRYSSFEYACAAAIAGGVALFAFATPSRAAKRLASPNAPLGYTLCFANLVLDGYTNAAQDALHAAWPAAHPLWTMAAMNVWTGLYTSIYLAIASDAGTRAVKFMAAHPAAAADVGLFCLCGAVGQLFIFATIKRFGSLTNTLLTTTRKFFNIMLSVAWLGSPLARDQWVGVAAVFGGLTASAVAKARAHAGGGKKKKL